MKLIVIPTYNRSAKLARVIDFYSADCATIKVVILDASDDLKHQVLNQKTAKKYADFVERIETPEQTDLVERLLNYLESIDDEIVAIGNDEDAFFHDFLNEAFSLLKTKPEYVVATGRYITSARSLFGVRRISFWTDTFLGMGVDDDEPAMRIVNFQRENSGGTPPIYWGVHRKSVFMKSSRLGQRLDYSSAVEVMNQITSCVMGKIWVSEQPMLLRDESRLHYVPENNRDEGELYIGEDDLNEIINIAKEKWDNEIVLAVKMVTSWYRKRGSSESYQSRLQKKVYCRFHPLPETKESRMLSWLYICIRWSCILGNLMSQFFAFLYYLKFMSTKGKVRQFLHISKTISVNK